MSPKRLADTNPLPVIYKKQKSLWSIKTNTFINKYFMTKMKCYSNKYVPNNIVIN